MIKAFAHDTVDAVQKGKQQFITTFVKHEGLADTMNKFVTAQSEYTKAASDAFIDTALSFSQYAVDKNFGKELMEAYGLDKFVPTVTSKKAK